MELTVSRDTPDELELSLIDANPLNPRKNRNKARDDELVESINRHGVLQPITVRPNGERFELVIGERRWRCAKAAGLSTIMGTVIHDLTDDECLEIMLIENGQRDDLDYMEEAETFGLLHKKFKLTLEEIARRVVKSKTTVHQRLKLLDLAPAVKKALAEGDVEISIAELIARAVHPSQHKEALERVGTKSSSWALSYREAKRLIESEYMLRLAGVPWKLDDSEYGPPCTKCPKRTGNQAHLFPDLKSKDVCLDPKCFAAKRTAARKRRLKEAAAEGAEVLEGKAAEELFDRYGDLKKSSGYVDLGAAAPLAEPGKRSKSIGQVLGKKFRPPVTVVAVPNSERIVELARKADVEKAFAAKGVKMRKERKEPATSPSESLHRRKTKVAAAVFDLQVERVVDYAKSVGTVTPPLPVLRAIATGVLESVWQDASDATTRRRGIEKAGHKHGGDHALAAVIKKASEGELIGLIVELLAQRERPRAHLKPGTFLPSVASAYGVRLKGVTEDARRYLRALEKRKAPKRGKAPRKRAKKKATKKSPRR